jgi:hypothetical protein
MQGPEQRTKSTAQKTGVTIFVIFRHYFLIEVAARQRGPNGSEQQAGE